MRRKKSDLTANLNGKVPLEVRAAIEDFANEEDLSLGESMRYFLNLGIEKHKVAMI